MEINFYQKHLQTMAETIFNKGKQVTPKMKEYILEHFAYDPETGMITRNDRRGSLGSLDKDGYLIIKVKQRQFKAHRIAWLLYYGLLPTMEIDHINRNRTDNRILNLREVDRETNINNCTNRINPITGVVGVYLDRSTPGLKKRYTTRLRKNTFRFNTLEEAVQFRLSHNLKVTI